VRIVREPNGAVSVGGAPGRGAWLCGPPSTEQCFERAVRRRALEQALRAPVPGDELAAVREKLMETTEHGGERE
jgi:predicted RNA-binding protein YlxR (DUF448 family)